MKSLNFQRNKSLIRITNEKKIKKRRNWDRIMYIILLCGFLIFMLYYFMNKAFMIHAYGHVIIESTRVRLTDDARLIDVNVQEGDSVVIGDTLFSYSLDLDQDINGSGVPVAGGGFTSKAGSTDYWWLKELYNIKKTITLNNIKIKENKDLVMNFEGELKRLTNEVILDVLPKQRLDYIQTEIMKINAESDKLKGENGELAELMKTLKPFETNPATVSRFKVQKGGGSSFIGDYMKRQKLEFSGELLSEEHYFRAPMTGIVTRIYIHSTETALRTEDIMSLHKDHPAFIKAFFDQKDLMNFKVGDIFKVQFPDGTSSYGVLRRFYIATYILPEEFQKKYEPTTRSIAADIYPLDESEMKRWQAFYKMSVDVSKFKY